MVLNNSFPGVQVFTTQQMIFQWRKQAIVGNFISGSPLHPNLAFAGPLGAVAPVMDNWRQNELNFNLEVL